MFQDQTCLMNGNMKEVEKQTRHLEHPLKKLLPSPEQSVTLRNGTNVQCYYDNY